MKPKIAIIQTDGINCDSELFYAFENAGGRASMIHINEMKAHQNILDDYQIIGIPGGFSYGDDVLSGKILANELRNRLKETLKAIVEQKKLIIGICNGFQVLVRTGLLPWPMKPAEEVSLIFNDSGHFECRWIKVRIQKSPCVFTQGLEDQVFELPVAHGEGKLVVANQTVGKKLFTNQHVVCQCVDQYNNPTQHYPENPNGSYKAIAGLTDATGHILGLMPHPERHTIRHQHPSWRSHMVKTCMPFFRNAVSFVLK